MKEATKNTGHLASKRQGAYTEKIVAEADRTIDPEITLRRTVQYGLSNYPEIDKEQQYIRFLAHLSDKYYAENGYLKFWIPESENAKTPCRTTRSNSRRI